MLTLGVSPVKVNWHPQGLKDFPQVKEQSKHEIKQKRGNIAFFNCSLLPLDLSRLACFWERRRLFSSFCEGKQTHTAGAQEPGFGNNEYKTRKPNKTRVVTRRQKRRRSATPCRFKVGQYGLVLVIPITYSATQTYKDVGGFTMPSDARSSLFTKLNDGNTAGNKISYCFLFDFFLFSSYHI